MLPDLEKIMVTDHKERDRVAQAAKEAQTLLDQAQKQVQDIQAELTQLGEKIQAVIFRFAIKIKLKGITDCQPCQSEPISTIAV
jgi:hypothetical protein